jgi:hypothetical protein
MYLEMYPGSGDEHKLGHAAALPHRRNNLWVARRDRQFIAWRIALFSRVQGWAQILWAQFLRNS